jgi:ribosome assembly protein YihI (activator of Der GTPase)
MGIEQYGMNKEGKREAPKEVREMLEYHRLFGNVWDTALKKRLDDKTLDGKFIESSRRLTTLVDILKEDALGYHHPNPIKETAEEIEELMSELGIDTTDFSPAKYAELVRTSREAFIRS